MSKSITFVRNPKIVAEQLCMMHSSMEAGRYSYLWERPCEETLCEELFLFKHGAKLLRLSTNKWMIKGYYSDGRDVDAAMLELKAAAQLRLAAIKLYELDALMHTPKEYRLTYTGIFGRYPNGQTSPSTYISS